MLIAVIATVLILGIVIVRSLQPTFFDLRTSKAEGKSRRAGFRAAFVMSIVIGAAVGLIGEFATLWPIRDLGVAVFLASVPILIFGIMDSRNESK